MPADAPAYTAMYEQQPFNGVFHRERGVRIVEITDGTSNTLGVGERASAFSPNGWAEVIPGGHLPIGGSLVVRTGHERVPFLIVAPTMLGPEAIERQNCYRAMRAILRIAAAHEDVGRAVYCPGLGTGVGKIPPHEAADEMAQEYRDWKEASRTTEIH